MLLDCKCWGRYVPRGNQVRSAPRLPRTTMNNDETVLRHEETSVAYRTPCLLPNKCLEVFPTDIHRTTARRRYWNLNLPCVLLNASVPLRCASFGILGSRASTEAGRCTQDNLLLSRGGGGIILSQSMEPNPDDEFKESKFVAITADSTSVSSTRYHRNPDGTDARFACSGDNGGIMSNAALYHWPVWPRARTFLSDMPQSIPYPVLSSVRRSMSGTCHPTFARCTHRYIWNPTTPAELCAYPLPSPTTSRPSSFKTQLITPPMIGSRTSPQLTQTVR